MATTPGRRNVRAPNGSSPKGPGAEHGYADGSRRTEILQAAASLIAASGLRTSLQEIAGAAGILPGSLYHHFESKEAILIELIRRYHADLDRIGELAQEKLDELDPKRVGEEILALGASIASCAVRHRAALQLTFHEPPAGADRELVELAQRPPAAVREAMLGTLRAGRWSGYIRPEIDLPTLADRICQTMLHVGLDPIGRSDAAHQVAAVLCQILLNGLASRPPGDDELNRSPAFLAANEVIDTWREAG